MKFPFKLSILKISFLLTTLFILLLFITENNQDLLPLFSSINLKASVDAKYWLRGTRSYSKDIILVGIDDKSFDVYGRWPWKRTIIADALKKIANGHPKVIALEIPFPVQDPYALPHLFNPLREQYERSHAHDPLYQDLVRISEHFDTDKILASTIKEINQDIPVVMGFFSVFYSYELSKRASPAISLLKHVEQSKIEQESDLHILPSTIPQALGFRLPIETLATSTPYYGFSDNQTDVDGIMRRSMLLLQYDNHLYPSLPLKVTSLFKNEKILAHVDAHGIHSLALGKQKVPCNTEGQVWVNYSGKTHTYPHMSFVDVLNGKVPSKAFENKIVLMAISAKSTTDTGTILAPMDHSFLSLEFDATVIENLIQNSSLIRPSTTVFWEGFVILLIAFILGHFYRNFRALPSAALSLLVIACFVGGDYILFVTQGILANSFIPSLYILSMFISNMTYKYFIEEKRSREIKNAFQHYVSPVVVQEILKNPDNIVLGGETREVTVLFADIRGFTTISEKIPPQQLIELLNIYMTEMTDIILQKGGMIDKYMGDEIMAVFGAPLPTETHAVDACLAAQDMIRQLGKVNNIWKERGVSEINIGIGISTGPVILGNMGSNKIFNYTVVGDTVNLASRLQELTKEYKTPIIVNDAVFENAKQALPFKELGSIQLRGKEKTSQVYGLRLV